MNIPEIILNKNKKVLLEPRFCNSVGGEPVQEVTIVELLYDGKFLIVNFECFDDPYVDMNSYTRDNTELWQQEVFEVFIASGNDAPFEYVEIEINPNNALFIANIMNPDKQGNGLKVNLISPAKSGISHHAIKGVNMWKGFMKIPLTLVRLSDNVLRVNFYRTILKEKPEDNKWVSTPENTVYACWRSTMADEPAFHKSEYFGRITLKDL